LKKAHLLRCARSPRSNVSVNTPPLVDFSRAWHLDLFEQPEIRFFNNRLGHWLEGRYESASILRVSAELCIGNLKHSQSLAKEISPTGEGVNHIVKRGEVQIVQAVQWFGRSRSLTAGFLDGLQFRVRRGITMTGSIFRSFLR
jgi:hypothetical protein